MVLSDKLTITHNNPYNLPSHSGQDYLLSNFLGAKHCIHALPPSNSQLQEILLIPYYRWQKGGSKRLRSQHVHVAVTKLESEPCLFNLRPSL